MFRSGRFRTGANYWASHAGTGMWKDYRRGVVESDLALLAGSGLTVLRVFPLWPDFQPLAQLYGGEGAKVEMRTGERALDDEGPGFAGIDPEMLERFRHLCDAAKANGIRLVVGLVTGWMSGRLFVPPALEGLNPIVDPVSRLWQVRFVRHFVRHFKSHPAVGAWDLGNECNVMGRATREEAWNWTFQVASAIRIEDPTRPVVSGMHSLPVDKSAPWNIRDQGELTDFLTTHPYPPFTPYAGVDPAGTFRADLHAAAETRLYADLGRTPAFIEEAGILGPFFGDAETARVHLRSMLVTGLMEDQRALLWWCAFDQRRLEHAPYDWNAVERELGLFTEEGKAKSVAEEMSAFQRFRKELPFESLPPRTCEAVCLLGPRMDGWAEAYGSFVISAQAGFSLRFALGEETLPDARFYLMPSAGAGMQGMPRRSWKALLEKVREGATLALSLEDGIVSDFEAITGFEVIGRSRREGEISATFDHDGERFELSCPSTTRLDLRATRAEVLAREPDGNPALGTVRFGKGLVITSTLPLEKGLLAVPGRFHGPRASEAWRLWSTFAKLAGAGRNVRKLQGRDVIVTEHPDEEGGFLLLAYNLRGAETEYVGRKSRPFSSVLLSSHPVAVDLRETESELRLRIPPYAFSVLRCRA